MGEIIDPMHSLFDFSKGINGSLMLLVFVPIFFFHSIFNQKLLSFVNLKYWLCG